MTKRATEAQVNLETIGYLQHVRILELGEPIACAATPAQIPPSDRPLHFAADIRAELVRERGDWVFASWRDFGGS